MNEQHKKILIKVVFLLAILVAFTIRLYVLYTKDIHVDETIVVTELNRVSTANIPIHFTGYGNGDSVVLSYLSLPFIKLFPSLNPVIILRLINLFFNLFFIWSFYHLAKLLFNQRTANIAAFFAIISPWSIFTASIAYNCCLLPFVLTSALYFFVKGVKQKKSSCYLYSFLLFSLMLYIYAISLLFVPIMMVILFFVYFRELDKKSFFYGLTLFVIVSIPIVLNYLKNQLGLEGLDSIWIFTFSDLDTSRFEQISIFYFYNGFDIIKSYLINFSLHFVLTSLIFHTTLKVFTLFHFVYFWDVVFILIGIIVAIRSIKNKSLLLLLLWFLLAPIVPSLADTVMGYSLTRDIHVLPALLLLSAIGVDTIYRKISDLKKD